MAGGEGGFSTKAMGFDKKEVNDYIANLNQRMKEIQLEKRDNDEKLQIALRKAQEADKKVKQAKDEGQSRIAELELELSKERRNQENLLAQIGELNQKIKNGDKGGKSDSGANNASAEIVAKANAEAKKIIDSANAAAKQTVDKANATAKETVEKAKAEAQKLLNENAAKAVSVNEEGLNELIELIGGFVNKVTSGAGEIKQKAAALQGAQSANRVTLPDLSAAFNAESPKAEAPRIEVPEIENSAFAVNEELARNFDAPSEQNEGVSADDLFSMLEDNGSSVDDGDMEMIGAVLPSDELESGSDGFGMDEFSLPETEDMDFDFRVAEVGENDIKNHGKADISSEFETQILAQNFTSSSLADQVDEDMLAAVRRQEERFAVKPSDDTVDFDMDMTTEDEDPLAAMIKQAEQLFAGTAAPEEQESSESDVPQSSSSAGSDASNPWAALQNELMAMEKSGDFSNGSDDYFGGQMSSSADPEVPNADDSAIWDFGDGEQGSSEDDDMGMSSDLFGNF